MDALITHGFTHSTVLVALTIKHEHKFSAKKSFPAIANDGLLEMTNVA